MFAIRPLGRIGDVVSGSEGPLPVITDEREVFGMVILVDGDEVHDHTSEHLFHLDRVLRKISGKGQEVGIVNVLMAEIGFQERGGRYDVPFVSTGTTSALPIVILAQMSDWMDTTR